MNSKKLFSDTAPVLCVLAVISSHGIVLNAQPADNATGPARSQPPAAAPVQQGGRGRAAVDTLGVGPWDLQSSTGTIHVTVVTKGLDHPWGMAFVPGGDILVTERPGRLRVIRKGVLDPMPVGPLPEIRAAVLGGLLDIALHPRFSENHLIYFTYSKPGKDDPAKATTAVARARWDGGSSLADVKDIFVAEPYFGGTAAPRGCCGQGPPDGSYGSRLAFDKVGFLYVTLGDRNYGEKSQDPAWDTGKIIRLKDDGSIPADNPFVGKEGYRPEIYSLGHRNPLGLAFNPVTGDLWSTEFGPRGGDELNLIRAGKNYGWMRVTKGEHYNGAPSDKSAPGMEEPVLFWVPSINPGNLTFYNGDKFPEWKGNILIATMTRSMLRIPLDADGKPGAQEKMLTELKQRFRDIRVGPDGFVYLLTDETFGAVLRVEPGHASP